MPVLGYFSNFQSFQAVQLIWLSSSRKSCNFMISDEDFKTFIIMSSCILRNCSLLL